MPYSKITIGITCTKSFLVQLQIVHSIFKQWNTASAFSRKPILAYLRMQMKVHDSNMMKVHYVIYCTEFPIKIVNTY